ncbi:hypothetical protein [Acidisphaera sp. L21]|uniref:hypothetical protein n=1 Tax=Acidisphaera sp. L21 TaxID=1641851 RepID=UPI00131C7F10|nr:hypothetical protein [Acidisphaera sp. L21]
MQISPSRSDDTAIGPAPLREALAELVQIGMSVARMLGRAAEAETALTEAAAIVNPDVSPVAISLAEAIEADRAASAAGEARRDATARAERLAAGFAQVSRAIRRTVMLAERLERGWARPYADDQRAMARRQADRAVRDAPAERLDSLDRLEDVYGRPVEAIVRAVCRDLGVDPVRMRWGREPESYGAPPHSPPGDSLPLDPSG